MAVRERSLDTPGLRLAAREWGEPGSRPLLALHGWLDNAATFDRLAPLLPGLHLVALDLPGHGLSDHRPPESAYHLIDVVADVLAVADLLGWRRFALLGHSLGAAVAALVPAAAPERVERLVLLEGFGPFSIPAANAALQLAEALAVEARLARARPRRLPDLAAAVAARVRDSDLDPDSARLLVERGVEQGADGVRFRHDLRLRADARLLMTEEQVRAFLAAIPCPVLAVRAHPGWPFDDELIAARLAVVPHLARVDVDGGHHLHLTHPERVAPAVDAFLSGPRAAG